MKCQQNRMLRCTCVFSGIAEITLKSAGSQLAICNRSAQLGAWISPPPPPGRPGATPAVARGTVRVAIFRLYRRLGRTDLDGKRLPAGVRSGPQRGPRSEEHTSELQSLMRNSYAVFC